MTAGKKPARAKRNRKSWVGRPFHAALIFVSVGLLWIAPAMARGGGHGMGGFGFHARGRMGRGGHMLAPAYVLITVLAVSDADAYEKAMEDMMTAVAPFTGRLAADAEKPPAWLGAPADHVVMIKFADVEQAQAWKNSDAYKAFEAGLQKSSASTIQLVEGLPVPEARGGRRGLDAKAFEPNVQDFDRLLNHRLKTICKGC